MNRWSIKSKILALCGLLILFSIAIGGIAFFGMNQMAKEAQDLSAVTLPNTYYLGKMEARFREIRINLRTLGIEGASEEQIQLAREGAKKYIAGYEEADQKYRSTPFLPGQEALYRRMNEEWLVFKKIGEKVLALSESKAPEDRKAMLAIFAKDCPEAAEFMRGAIEKLNEFHDQEAKDSTAHLARSEALAKRMIFISLLLGVIVAGSTGFRVATSLARSIQGVANTIADEADAVASASSQIASTSHELSSSTTEQAAALQETASSVEEMSAMVRKNAENAASSSGLAQTGAEAASEGQKVLGEMVHAIQDINEANSSMVARIEESNNQISEIVKVIGEIGNKTKVINDIVFQTKLLSFNASVEAARAGEHGKGFAVVAEEVGNLAQMSGNAAKEISSMLDESIGKVEGIVRETRSRVESLVSVSQQKIEAGSAIVVRCKEVLDSLAGTVTEVNGKVGEISTASQEQAQGVQEINKAMAQLDQVTQQNASASHQASSAAQQLAGQAERLKAYVGDLRVAIEGGVAREPARGSGAPGSPGASGLTDQPALQS